MTVIKSGKLSYIGIMNDKATPKSPEANTNVSITVVEPNWSSSDNFSISGMPIPKQGFHIGDTIEMGLTDVVKTSNDPGVWDIKLIPMRVMELSAYSDTEDDDDEGNGEYTINSAAITLRSVELYNGFYIEVNTIISNLTKNKIKVNDVIWFSLRSK